MADLVVFNEYAGGGPIEQINSAAGSCAVGNMVFNRAPTVTDDTTAGFIVGSRVFDATAGILRWYKCRDNTAGAAKWVIDGVDYLNGGTNPNFEVTQFGLGAGLMAEEGNIYREVIASRNPGIINQDNIIALYTLPASSFDVTGRGLNLMAQGSVVANVNSKRIKLWVNPTAPAIGSIISGGTLIADTGAYTTSLAAGYCIEANVFKYGAPASNTQLAIHVLAQIGAAVGALLPPTLLTGTESATMTLAVTGNAVTATTDIVQNFFEVNAMN